MNILHILSRFDSYDAIQSALELSRHLNINSCNSIVASSLDEKGLGNISPNLEYHKLSNFERNIKDLFVSYHILRNIIMSKKIDIVHIHSMASMWLGFLICRNTQSRLALSCYNFHRKNISSERLIMADKVIVHNEAVGKQLISDFNLSSYKVRFINPGIDTDNFNFQGIDQRSKTDFTIGVIPSLMPEAGYEYFLKAMVKVTRIIPYINISILISPFHSRKNIQEDLGFWTRRLGLSNYVKFIDISNLDTKFLTRLNLLVYAPIAENALTRIILESQAYGVPVIA
ncbi:MAG: glycosyltransferase, partial [Candidatus Omnitrophica bacterium]|nr:glycosyltransferase [Candidatus Omnitrophota bacterium]